ENELRSRRSTEPLFKSSVKSPHGYLVGCIHHGICGCPSIQSRVTALRIRYRVGPAEFSCQRQAPNEFLNSLSEHKGSFLEIEAFRVFLFVHSQFFRTASLTSAIPDVACAAEVGHERTFETACSSPCAFFVKSSPGEARLSGSRTVPRTS